MKDSLLEHGFELVELYRSDPVLAAYDLLNVKLAPAHRIVLRDMWAKNFVISVCSRGFGKTFLLAVVAVLSTLLYPGYRVGLLAPTYRQSKNIFFEIERIYQKSPIFQAACEKRPTRGSDSCYVKFKGSPGSWIEALPLGDGTKIRGSRFYTILVDEFAFMPEKIFSTVIKPMAAVTKDPMENVERIRKQEELIKRGLLDPSELDEGTNKIIAVSTGFFKFNHMWKRMKEYWRRIEEGSSKYAVHQIPYTYLPRGFLDENSIAESKATMSQIEFQMEYEALMVDDSDGAFKASLLEECTSISDHSIELLGLPGSKYVLGVDTASKQDHFAVTVVRLGSTRNRIVNALEKKNLSFPDMARVIYELANKYNIVRICMDRFGGGESLKDILKMGLDGNEPILEIDDKSPTIGKRILELCTPSPRWITNANFGAKALLEKKELSFPLPPTGTSDWEADAYEAINRMKSQILNIVMTQNASGSFRFNTPKKGMKKDLYSSFILASWAIMSLKKDEEEDNTSKNIIHTGLIQPRVVGGFHGHGYLSG